MIELLQMCVLVEVLGIMCLPLTITVFHNLPDRGWALTKTIGLALLAFCVWFPLMTIHFLFFNQIFIASVLLVIFTLNVIGFVRVRHALAKFIRLNLSYILVSETIFLGMVFLLGWIRSYGPDIRSFEMFMDEGFIAAIMRSPHFPPNDMWFSGNAINYYYYAHYTIAVLAKLLGQPPSIAFNTGICIFFGLTAVNLFGVSSNIVSWARYLRQTGHIDGPSERSDSVHPSLLGAIPYGLLTIVMALVLGNLAATQQWFQIHGDILQFDWFSPSRVVGNGTTINEFPAFSFLLSCFHAHVLALAFTIVAVALALNLFLASDGRGLRIFGRGWCLPLTLGITALILGGLFTMNGWDYPTYVGIALICIALQQWLTYEKHFRLELVLDVLTIGAALIALSFFLFAPFYLTFVSPSQGIGLVNPLFRSQLNQEVLIYGMFAFLFLSLLFICFIKQRNSPRLLSQVQAGDATIGVTQDVAASEDRTVLMTRSKQGWLNMKVVGVLLVAIVGLGTLVFMKNSLTFVVAGSIAAVGSVLVLYHVNDRPRAFILLLGAVGFALVALCEVLILKDVFADGNYLRMNTVFKFYFQSWVLLSIACSTGVYFILEGLRPAEIASGAQIFLQQSNRAIWVLVFLVFLLAGAVYPLAGTYARTNHFAQRTNSLDGLTYLQSTDPGDYAAIQWLNSHIENDPVIVESVGPDYSDYGRVSVFTGLPTLMGWVGHEYQWRVNWLNKDFNNVDFSRRSNSGGDIDLIYTDTRPTEVLSLMAHYQAQYLYVGPLELAKYPTANLHRFSSFMNVVYSANGVTIYQVKKI